MSGPIWNYTIMKQICSLLIFVCYLSVLCFGATAQEVNSEVEQGEIQTELTSSMRELTPEQLEQYAFPEQQDNFESRDLTAGQVEILENMRKAAKELLQRKLGILSVNGTKSDLAAIQSLVNRRMVRLDDVIVWQNLGVVFGDVLAREFNMIWVIYEDDLGASKALRWRKTDNFLFPVTMLSKRAKYGEEINLEQIFDELSVTVDEFKAWESQPKLPNPIKSR
ncbi:MAG: DUF3806 domain-containing protein [Pseudomonadales bacterium]|nr:DUF3806 domain-containing protein [Pseudomonadales bacterium]MDG1443890.1 DUF3806 domain-containing protein [Pseudomonadales bacterium]